MSPRAPRPSRAAWLTAAGCLLAPLPALATAIAPTVTLVVDGSSVGEIPLTSDPNTGAFFVEGFHWANASVADVTLNLLLDPDPQIVYAGSVIDFGAPSTFGFVFQQGIAPTPAPGIVTHQHSSSTTDGGAPAGTSVTAVAPLVPVDSDGIPEIAVYNLSQNACATFVNAGLDASPSFVGASPGDTQGSFNLGPIAGPSGSGSYDCMRVDVNFAMTGNNDAYTFNGTAEVVPEPASAALLGLGLAGLALAGRRRA